MGGMGLNSQSSVMLKMCMSLEGRMKLASRPALCLLGILIVAGCKPSIDSPNPLERQRAIRTLGVTNQAVFQKLALTDTNVVRSGAVL